MAFNSSVSGSAVGIGARDYGLVIRKQETICRVCRRCFTGERQVRTVSRSLQEEMQTRE